MSSKVKDDDSTNMLFSVNFGLNNNFAWEVEPSFTYYFHKYIGVTLGLDMTKQFSAEDCSGRITNSKDLFWEIDEDDRKVSQLLFRPSMSFRLPIAWLDKDHETSISLVVEPGISMAFPPNKSLSVSIRDGLYYVKEIQQYKSSNSKWLFWNLRVAPIIRLDRINISAGYTISNVDVYASRRNIVIKNADFQKQLPARRLTHTGFVGLGVNF